jgi:hypothetical protein
MRSSGSPPLANASAGSQLHVPRTGLPRGWTLYPPGVERAGDTYVLRAERPVGSDVLLLPVRPAKNRGSRFSAVVPADAPAAPSNG